MKISVNESGRICLSEVYEPIVLVADDETYLMVCERNGHFDVRRFLPEESSPTAPQAWWVADQIERLRKLAAEQVEEKPVEEDQ